MSKLNMNKIYRSFFSLIFCLLMFTAIYGCGTGSDTSTPGPTPTPTDLSSLTLALTKVSDGTSTAAVSTGHPTRLTATATDENGALITGKVVTFTQTITGMVTFSPASAALTSAGVASVILYAGTAPGATEISASITTAAGKTITSRVGIAVATSNLSFSTMTITPSPLSAGGHSGSQRNSLGRFKQSVSAIGTGHFYFILRTIRPSQSHHQHDSLYSKRRCVGNLPGYQLCGN